MIIMVDIIDGTRVLIIDTDGEWISLLIEMVLEKVTDNVGVSIVLNVELADM